MRKETPTNFFTYRHGEKTKLNRVRTNDSSEMVGKTYTIRPSSSIYKIDGNLFTEKEIDVATEGQLFKVDDVLMIDSEVLHPSTWNQNTNIFIASGKGYVHFGSLENIIDTPKRTVRAVKAGAKKVEKGAEDFGKFALKTIVGAIIAFIIIELIIKKA